jgi:A/G-specific adenine glycosylase
MRIPASIPVAKRLGTFPADSKNVAAFRRSLLRWYDQHGRDLPWRKTQDPYRIWLSEVMLQQTRVAAVLGHYRVFLERFPGVRALAAASENEVLAAWSGLGYYRRARMMHRCAKELVQARGGQFPQTARELEKLPGIGRYTAAAIASIAFAEPVAVVDGNVERILRRLTGVKLTAPQIWRHAQTLLASARAGDFNQAAMELGATVCVPREPRCLLCPVQKWCATQGEAPRVRSAARQTKQELWCMLEVRDGNASGRKKVLLVQRPKEASLMANMWELPLSCERPGGAQAAAIWRTFRHSVTVTNYTVHVLGNTQLANLSSASKSKWIAVDCIPQMPITGLTRKILKAGGII